MKTKLLSLILIFIMMLSLSLPVSSEGLSIYVDKEKLTFGDAFPFIEGGRTLIPLRSVAEKMGATVLWDEANRMITINKPCEEIMYAGDIHKNATAFAVLYLDKKELIIGLRDKSGTQIYSEYKKMDTTAKAVNGRTYIPARFVGYALGYEINFNRFDNRIDYSFIGKQTLTFSFPSEEKPEIGFSYNKEKYPDITVSNGVPYPSRQGYNGITIIDATEFYMEGSKYIYFFPYKFTSNNIIVECDKPEYQVSNENTMEENLDIFAKFYEDKTNEDIIDTGYGLRRTAFSTNEVSGSFSITDASDKDFIKYHDGAYLFDTTKKYYHWTNNYPTFDFTRTYFINDDPMYGGNYHWYGLEMDSILTRGNDKNTILFLNMFLGETGQKIWTMMNEYFMMSGPFYQSPGTCLDDIITYRGEFYDEDIMDGISTENAEKYGFKVVANERVTGLRQILLLETEEQRIYIEYTPVCLLYTADGYSVYFEKIEK